jgi:hypothetical protein
MSAAAGIAGVGLIVATAAMDRLFGLWNDPKPVVYGAVGFIAVLYLIDWLFGVWDDSKEPPRARSRIPLIGHLLGLFRTGTAYYSKVR